MFFFQYVYFLCLEQGVNGLRKLLHFMTSFEKIPPLGLPSNIDIEFDETCQQSFFAETCTFVLRPRTHGNDFMRFCIVSINELVVLNSLENSKQYKNAGKRFCVYRALECPLLNEPLTALKRSSVKHVKIIWDLVLSGTFYRILFAEDTKM